MGVGSVFYDDAKVITEACGSSAQFPDGMLLCF